MNFVKVKHRDGREADITPAEVAFYGSIGFAPVDGQAVAGQAATASTGAAALPPAATGTELRLDLIIDELRAIRTAFTPVEPIELEAIEVPGLNLDLAPLVDEIRGLRADVARTWGDPEPPADGESIELREPATANRPNLTAMSRKELDAYAVSVGIADPAASKNIPELIAAIEAATAGKD